MIQKLFFGLALAGVSAIFTSATAQPAMAPTRTITVFGTVEKTVEPDEIYLSINISEYQDDAGLTVGIKELEQRMLRAVSDAGIPAADIRVDNISGFGSYQVEGQGFMPSKNYLLKTKNIASVNLLIAKLGDSGVSSINTMYFSHSQVNTYMNDLKAQAMKAAREKAEMLLRASNEKPGKIISIEEQEDFTNLAYPGGGMGNYSRKPMFSADPKGSKEIGFVPVNFVSSVKVTFEIL